MFCPRFAISFGPMARVGTPSCSKQLLPGVGTVLTSRISSQSGMLLTKFQPSLVQR